MALRGERVPADQLLLAVIADDLNLLHWKLANLSGGGTPPPKSLFQTLQGIPDAEDTRGVQGFDSAEGFEAARRAALGGEEDGD